VQQVGWSRYPLIENEGCRFTKRNSQYLNHCLVNRTKLANLEQTVILLIDTTILNKWKIRCKNKQIDNYISMCVLMSVCSTDLECIKGCKLKFAWMFLGLPSLLLAVALDMWMCKAWAHGGCGGSWKSSWETNTALSAPKDTMQCLSCILLNRVSVWSTLMCHSSSWSMGCADLPSKKTQVPVPISAGVKNSKP